MEWFAYVCVVLLLVTFVAALIYIGLAIVDVIKSLRIRREIKRLLEWKVKEADEGVDEDGRQG